MPRPCAICSSPHSGEIIPALALGTRYSVLATRFGVDKSAVCRHVKYHLSATAQRLIASENALQRDVLKIEPALEQLQRLNDHLRKIALVAEAKKRLRYRDLSA
jgi:hypothetical protein